MTTSRHLRAVPETPGRALLYTRVSELRGRGGDDFHSPDVQLASMRRAISMAGLREVAVVGDLDQTGRNFNRDGIDQIRRMAELRQIDAVAVYDISRLGRNVLESLKFLAWLAERGVTIVSACEQIDTSTPAGKHMLVNMLSIAQYRSDEIGRTWATIATRRAEAGYAHNRARGYLQQNRQLAIHPVEGPAMRQALYSYAAGVPIGQINQAYARAIGRMAWAANLKTSFRNPVYIGQIRHGGKIYAGNHEPLLRCDDGTVDLATWQRIQDRIARESHMPPRALHPTWSMVGLVQCPNGHNLLRMGTRLQCAYRRGGVSRGCDGVGNPLVARVEAEVLRQVADYVQLLRTDVTGHAVHVARHTQATVDVGALERQLAVTRTGMVKVTTAWSVGTIDDPTYEQSLTELRDAESALLGELETARAVVDLPTPGAAAGAGEELLRLWDDLTVDERGRALRTVVDRVVVRRAARWREPEEDRITVVFHTLRPAQT